MRERRRAQPRDERHPRGPAPPAGGHRVDDDQHREVLDLGLHVEHELGDAHADHEQQHPLGHPAAQRHGGAHPERDQELDGRARLARILRRRRDWRQENPNRMTAQKVSTPVGCLRMKS